MKLNPAKQPVKVMLYAERGCLIPDVACSEFSGLSLRERVYLFAAGRGSYRGLGRLETEAGLAGRVIKGRLYGAGLRLW